MAQVAAGGKVHAEQSLVSQRLADLAPLVERHLVPVGGYELLGIFDAGGLHQRGQLDLGPQDGPEGDEIGIRAAVRLGISVVGAEELPGTRWLARSSIESTLSQPA